MWGPISCEVRVIGSYYEYNSSVMEWFIYKLTFYIIVF